MKSLPINFVQKGWGWESWIANNDQYCGKLLFFKKGKRCSFHYHKKKHETFYVQSGKLLVVYSDNDCKGPSDKLNVCALQGEPLVGSGFGWLYNCFSGGNNVAQTATLEPGDVFEVPVGLRHAMYGLLDTEMFEFSTHHEDEDSYRILKGD
jgi:quercetin dioxygenase-like cupin family protein